MSKPNILVVDDEPDIRELLKDILEDEGYQVVLAADANSARAARRQRRPDLHLLDIWMPGGDDGMVLLQEWSSDENPTSPIIMMSGHGTIDTAVKATRIGAYDFLEKPLSMGKLLVTVKRALESAGLQRENLRLRTERGLTLPSMGDSPLAQALQGQIDRLAEHDTTVFIFGETGTGKESIARRLHEFSARKDGPFISVNIAGLSPDQPAVELFGSEQDEHIHYGYLEQANGGTLFLKDIADLDMNLQAQLLKAIAGQDFLRVGGRSPVQTDVRVIAATRHDLQQQVTLGQFREDLFYHLNVVPLEAPPLREHLDDMPLLVEASSRLLHQREGLPIRPFSSGAIATLKRHPWPGNLRELQNLVQRLLILGGEEAVSVTEVEQALGLNSSGGDQPPPPPGYDRPLREAREQFEHAYFEYQLRTLNGSVTKTAERTGIERTHLYRKMRTLGLDPKSFKNQKA